MKICLIFFLFIGTVDASVRTHTDTGLPVYWNNTDIEIYLNPESDNLSTTVVESNVNISLQEWTNKGDLNFTLISTSALPANKNTISFVESGPYIGSGIVAVTSVQFSNLSGVIAKADIFLNERDFNFNNVPGSNPQVGQNIYLADVITHEMGHFLGLGHSEVLDSSMIFTAFKNQFSIAHDDANAINYIYPKTASSREITGRVAGGADVEIFGAHVKLVSARNGKIIASALSKDDGTFVIGGLPDVDDNYYVMISPIRKLNSLPSYYSTSKKNFCPSTYVTRFFSKCSATDKGFPQRISSDTQSVIDLGTLSIGCDIGLSPDYLAMKNEGEDTFSFISTADNLLNGGKSFVGYFPATSVKNPKALSTPEYLEIDLSGVSSPSTKTLKLSVLSQNLGVKMDNYISLYRYDSGNNLILVSAEQHNETALIFILNATAANNRYVLKVHPELITTLTTNFPEPSAFVESQYFYFVMADLVETANNENFLSINEEMIEDNLACLDAPNAYSVQADISTLESNEQSQLYNPACGTLDIDNDQWPQGPMNLIISFLAIFALFRPLRKHFELNSLIE
ncbi:MAG: matrixin family metalloprotease [Bacteriovoracaceae bacterium]|nr:matrixin family metalloprotease [Bacteriovoracaceae bacterium]